LFDTGFESYPIYQHLPLANLGIAAEETIVKMVVPDISTVYDCKFSCTLILSLV